MVKRLQKSAAASSMLVCTVLLLIFFCTVNVANAVYVNYYARAVAASVEQTQSVFIGKGRLLLITSVFCLLCWIIALALSIILSKKAVKPALQSIENQRRLIINAEHEIKTPLAIIGANAEAMELCCEENKYTKNIRTQTERMSLIIKNLLLLSRFEEGSVKLSLEKFPLSEMLSKAVTAFTELFEAKKITVETEIETDVIISSDREKIGQLIGILLDNAYKYTNVGGAVTVSLKGSALMIENTCSELPSVPPEMLFERFYTGSETGNGIGLAAAGAIAKTLGIEISAEYKENNTVLFTVRL